MPLTIPHLPIGLLGSGGLPITDNVAAWFRRGVGFSVSTGVSAWADQSGNARNLLQATGANQPALQGDGTILFNGTTHFLKCAAFTLAQPETIYLRMKQVTWTINDVFTDGDTANTGQIFQSTVTPTIQLFAGAAGANTTALPVNTWGSVAAVFNGASSLIQVGGSASASVSAGAGNMGGFTLGAAAGAALHSNIQVAEVIVYSVAHDATQRAAVIAYLNSVGP